MRDQKSLIEDADILTAAFCLNHGFTLVTNNTGHFQAIPGLRFCDWA
jgi:tRNA(fMet)-specific endonuclease VapC